jgi:hypothetical protein
LSEIDQGVQCLIDRGRVGKDRCHLRVQDYHVGGSLDTLVILAAFELLEVRSLVLSSKLIRGRFNVTIQEW